MKTAMESVRLIIFDFDGTLGDTRENILRTFRDTIALLVLPARDDETLAATIGLPLAEGFAQLFPDFDEDRIAECTATYRSCFEKNKKLLVPKLFPGVRETLAELHSSGITMSVASSRSSKSLLEFLDEMGVATYLPYVLGANNVTHAKPHPEPVLKTLADLGVEASRALVVGDMPVDILMGSRAGVLTCGVTWGNASREALACAGADYIIDSMPELLEIV